MRLPITIDGEVLYAEIPDEEINKLIAKKKKKTWYERAKLGQSYYAINDFREIFEFDEENESHDQSGYDVANYYTDKEVAENMARVQKLWNQINRRSVELCEPVCTQEEILLYTIYFYPDGSEIQATSDFGRCFGSIYFDTREHCQQVIDEFHDELMWYFTEFKNRADM